MARKKLIRFAAIKTFQNVLEPPFDLKGKWNTYFGNDHPITLELGCGKGEYSLGLGKLFPRRNFVGIDCKGERIWRGAQSALNGGLNNVAFAKIRIEYLLEYFGENEVSEIWIPFSDPFPKPSKSGKRLTSPRFLQLYRTILQPGGIIHVKTDHSGLFKFTLETAKNEGFQLRRVIHDLHVQYSDDDMLAIETTYERRHRALGKPIYYAKFSL